jgi:hypothetical protein
MKTKLCNENSKTQITNYFLKMMITTHLTKKVEKNIHPTISLNSLKATAVSKNKNYNHQFWNIPRSI